MNSLARSVPLFALAASSAYALAASPKSASPVAKPLSSSGQARVVEGYGKLPLSFEPNQGQAEPEVRFLSRGDGYTVSLTPSAAVLSLNGKTCPKRSKIRGESDLNADEQVCVPSPGSVLRMTMLGSNPDVRIGGDDALPGVSNYFVGNDSSKWHTNIPNYRRVQYRGVYPGVDLVYYGNQRQLEHDFIVAPGADPKTIRLSFAGAKATSVDSNGNLAVTTGSGKLLLKRPVAYQQQENGLRKLIYGRYTRSTSTDIGFDLGAYDKTKELVIDPVLTYSTFVGSSFSVPIGVGVDSLGNTYVVARSRLSESVGAVLITKVDQAGSRQLYSTLIGNALAYGMAVDAQGGVYVTGSTGSQDFPIVNAFQNKLNGSSDAFITKIDPSGTKLIYSTYFGTGAYGSAIAVDNAGSAYITGVAFTSVPLVTSLSNGPGPYISKFSPSGSSLEYSTYIAGSAQSYDTSNAIAVDPAGEAVITGETRSKNFPTTNGLYRKCVSYKSTPCDDIFITKINASGTGIVYSTFLAAGAGAAVATNADGDAFVSGRADVKGFPLVNALYPDTSFDNLAFLTRINAAGSALVYSTFLDPNIGVAAIAIDKESDVYATGFAVAGLPVVNAIQPQFGGGGADAYVIKISASGAQLLYSTYLGGSQAEGGQSIAVDAYDSAYVIGNTFSADFPLKNPIPTPANPEPTFLAKISESSVFTVANTVDHTTVRPGGPLAYTITVTNTGSVAASGILTDKTVRGPIMSCQVSNGDLCRFVVHAGKAIVSFAPFAPGESRTITISANAARTAGDYNEVGNIATLLSSSPVYERDFASAPVTVRETADIGIASSLTDSTNGLLHYVHTVTNLGPDNAHAVLLLDPLPPYTTYVSASTTAGECSFHPTIGTYGAVRCPLNNPVAGTSVQVNVVLQATSAACPAISNTASVTSQSVDGNSTNDAATVVTQLPVSICKN